MNFELTQSQKSIMTAAREFALKEFDPELALELEKKHEFPKAIYKKAASLGFVAPYVDETYGGYGLTILENVLIVEEFCRADSSIGLAIDLAALPCKFLFRYGNHDQKTRYLSKITSGEFGAAIALTEPDHGSDITSMDTVAIRKNGAFRLSGTKTFITNGTIADFYTVLCQTDPDASPKYKGMSILIVDRERSIWPISMQKKENSSANPLPAFRPCSINLWTCTSRSKMHGIWSTRRHSSSTRASAIIGPVALAKYYAANIANEVAYDAMQVFGGYGYFQEYKVERYYRDARILSIYEGTAEIQKNIIGTSLFPNLT